METKGCVRAALVNRGMLVPNQESGHTLEGRDHGTVVVFDNAPERPWDEHERGTLANLSERLAYLLGYEYLGLFDPSNRPRGHIYFVPRDTLLTEHASPLGIQARTDLFGGIVPNRVLRTKLISHPVVDERAHHPTGWSHALARQTSRVTLPGYSAFERRDLRRAAQMLLRRGPVRLKLGTGVGGHGQTVAQSARDIDAVLEGLSDREIAEGGVVVEINLVRSLTYSVGQVHFKDQCFSYYGTQRCTIDNHGEEVYAGSDLRVVRGDFDDLLNLRISPDTKLAIRQVKCFDSAICETFPEFIVSRNNYDVIQGCDQDGRPFSGVLEQSWRIGGASPAEIAAIEAFEENPHQQVVNVSSVEQYGTVEPPRHARIHYSGVDSRIGQIVKFTVIEAHEHSPSVIYHTC